jgi:hypothetical protein
MKVGPFLGNVTFIKGKVFLMPYHYVPLIVGFDLPMDTMIDLINSEGVSMFKFPVNHIINNKTLSPNCVRLTGVEGDKDAVLVDVHRMQGYPCADITKLFIHDYEQGKLSAGEHEGALTTFKQSTRGPIGVVKTVYKINALDSTVTAKIPTNKTTFFGNKVYDEIKMRKCYYYQGQTTKGDCGSLLVVFNKFMERKIVGVHVAVKILFRGAFSRLINLQVMRCDKGHEVF